MVRPPDSQGPHEADASTADWGGQSRQEGLPRRGQTQLVAFRHVDEVPPVDASRNSYDDQMDADSQAQDGGNLAFRLVVYFDFSTDRHGERHLAKLFEQALRFYG